MAQEFVDIYLVEIDGMEMESIKSISVTASDSKNPVKTMNRDRVALGVTQGVQEWTGKISAVRQFANPEMDWHAWKALKQAKNIVYEMGPGGQRVSLIDVYVSSVDEKADEGGEIMWDIDLVILNRKED